MKERPILFSAPMVRAILAGQKTQTRRGVKPQPEWTEPATTWLNGDGHSGPGWYAHNEDYPEEGSLFYRCPYGQPGDRLWVKETFQRFSDDGEIMYKADPASFQAMNELKYDECQEARWRPSIFMPRWASRILLEVVSIRVERLHDISDADAQEEGCSCYVCGAHLDGKSEDDCHCFHRKAGSSDYRVLWESINGAGSWDANPWVWVVEFKRIESPKIKEC